MAEHACPGGCGRSVTADKLACRACWFLLPQAMRQEVWRWYRADSTRHRQAVTAALNWYKHHMKDGEVIG
jgi:hypothetical protein